MNRIPYKAKVSRWTLEGGYQKTPKVTPRIYDQTIPEALYIQVLECCMENRLQGARASESARKILEQLVENGYYIPEKAGNYCISNSLADTGTQSTHQGFGGIDTALAMVHAMEKSFTPTAIENYEKLILALAKEGTIDEALTYLRYLIVDKWETPPLSTFAAVAKYALTTDPDPTHADRTLQVLAYLKVAGYDLDTIGNVEDGRSILASAVIAANRLENDALGFRFLKAASQANISPDRGDVILAQSSVAAQRACTLIHKRSINKAVEDSNWKLVVKILELMLQRSLKPSPWIWRNVVTCCAKAEKSRKATALLLDWVKLYENGKAEIPPLSVFNTVVNACEICNEQELTLMVLDAMKKTHDTDGNLITFNIALKRLAKQGNFVACEGIIVGMLQAGIEPSVVSYTTDIAATVAQKQAKLAYEWLRRMRSRRVQPNVITYNTALASCADGTLEGSILGSRIAQEMLNDVDLPLSESDEDLDEYRNVIPDSTSKSVARRLMQQLKSNWSEGEINKREATDTVRVPLLKLVDFSKSECR
jgi:pentatricopeptide repeat protein